MGRIVDFLQLLNSSAGFISLGVIIVGGFIAIKSGVLKSTSEAQSSAIAAMQSEMAVFRGRIEDKDKENVRLNQKIDHLELTIDTICAALKKKGFIISIQSEMVSIEDRRGSSTTARIRPVRLKQDDEAL